MSGLRHTTTCITCGEGLIQNPVQTHWWHCPRCEPEWTAHVVALHEKQRREAYARFATEETRGRPTRGGKKT